MKHNLFFRLLSLLLCLCLLPATALGYGETPVYQDPVTHTDIELTLDLFPEAFPDPQAADYQGWQEFLDKLLFKGSLDLQNPLTEKVRAWFDGGLYLNNRMTIPFQVDVYFTFRYLQSRVLKGESMFFKMENFLEFMMKPRYFMDLPTDYIALLMYPEATLDICNRFYTPLAKLCEGEGNREVSYDDLYDLCLSWEEMYMNDGEDYYKLYFFFTCLLYNLGINYDVYDQIGMLTAYLDMLDPEGKGLIITEKEGVETYTIGGHKVFTRKLDSTRTFTLDLPDENGNLLSVTSRDDIHEDWNGDNWFITLNITLAPEEEGAEPENFLALQLNMRDVPLRDLYQTPGTVEFIAEGTALDEPFYLFSELFFERTDLVLPNKTTIYFSPYHPETGKKMLTAKLRLYNSEVPFTVLQERIYDNEDIFHLNDEYLQRIKENYIPSMALNFLPVILEMPAGVINDILRFAEETDILVSLGIE
ncbi:MAG: hypothetical protein E7323_11345 [Clostridiales bacterium]|nr:hypothetical protein [Clostridiales bacterium]